MLFHPLSYLEADIIPISQMKKPRLPEAKCHTAKAGLLQVQTTGLFKDSCEVPVPAFPCPAPAVFSVLLSSLWTLLSSHLTW